MALTKCPECGVSLEGRSPRKHSLSHWPPYLPPYPQNEEARKRQKALEDEEARRSKVSPATNPE